MSNPCDDMSNRSDERSGAAIGDDERRAAHADDVPSYRRAARRARRSRPARACRGRRRARCRPDSTPARARSVRCRTAGSCGGGAACGASGARGTCRRSRPRRRRRAGLERRAEQRGRRRRSRTRRRRASRKNVPGQRAPRTTSTAGDDPPDPVRGHRCAFDRLRSRSERRIRQLALRAVRRHLADAASRVDALLATRRYSAIISFSNQALCASRRAPRARSNCHADLRIPLLAVRPRARGAAEALRRAADRRARRATRATLVKQVSAAGFQLKGSGWYVTDFRGGSKPRQDAATVRRRKPTADTTRQPRPRRPRAKPESEAATEQPERNEVGETTSTATHCARHDADAIRYADAPMKRYLIAGLLVWVPLGITIWVLHFLLTTLDQTLLLLPESIAAGALLGLHIPGLGVLLAFADPARSPASLAANFFGQRLIRLWEAVLGRIPVREVDLLVGQAGLATRCCPTRATRSARRCWCSSRTRTAGRSRS